MKKTLLNSWIKNLNRNSSENTVSAYTQNMNQMYKHFEENFNSEEEMIKAITYTDIEKYIEQLEDTYANSTINQKIITLNLFFEYCKKKIHLTVNPCEGMTVFNSKKIKETEKEKYVPTKEEVLKIINACDSKTNREKKFDFLSIRNKAIVSILATTGLRISELAESKMSDLEEYNNEEGTIFINVDATRNKTNTFKRVPITGIALKHFKDYLIEKKLNGYDSEYVFVSHNNKQINRRNYNDILETLIKKANIKVGESSFSMHSFRHFTASMLTKDGNNSVVVINDLLGWSNAGQMISRYSHTEFFDKEKISICSKILA